MVLARRISAFQMGGEGGTVLKGVRVSFVLGKHKHGVKHTEKKRKKRAMKSKQSPKRKAPSKDFLEMLIATRTCVTHTSRFIP